MVIWDLETGQPAYIFSPEWGAEVNTVAISPDGTQLAYGSGIQDEVFRFNLSTRKLMSPLSARGDAWRIKSIKFSPDGQLLTSGFDHTGDYDEPVEIWNLKNETMIVSIRGHEGGVAGIAFSPSGDLLASMSIEGHVYVWNTLTWLPKHEFNAFDDDLVNIAFSPDGRWLTIASYRAVYFRDMDSILIESVE